MSELFNRLVAEFGSDGANRVHAIYHETENLELTNRYPSIYCGD